MSRDRGVVIAMLLFGLLVSVAAKLGSTQLEQMNFGVTELEARNHARFTQSLKQLKVLSSTNEPKRGRDPRDPLFMGQEGLTPLIHLPAGPMAVLAVGQRATLPQSMRVAMGIHLTPEENTEAPMVSPTNLSLGAFDLAFVFVVIFPLLMIALVYGVLSGERERGTLAMLLSQPISQNQLVIGKTVARMVMALSVTCIFLMVGFWLGDVSFDSKQAIYLVLLTLVLVFSWLLFWFGAGVFVNALGYSSANNALILVGAWLALVVVLPGGIQVVLNSVYPSQSSVDLMHEMREAGQSAEADLNALTGSHDNRQQLAGFGAQVVAKQRDMASKVAPIIDAAHAVELDRAKRLRALSFLSPATLMQTAIEDIAGSGRARYAHFETQAEAFQQRFTQYFYALIERGDVVDFDVITAVPEFQFEDEDTGLVCGRVLLAAAALAGLGLLMLFLAAPRLREIGRLTR